MSVLTWCWNPPAVGRWWVQFCNRSDVERREMGSWGLGPHSHLLWHLSHPPGASKGAEQPNSSRCERCCLFQLAQQPPVLVKRRGQVTRLGLENAAREASLQMVWFSWSGSIISITNQVKKRGGHWSDCKGCVSDGRNPHWTPRELEGVCVLSRFHSRQPDLCLACMELVVELQLSSLIVKL